MNYGLYLSASGLQTAMYRMDVHAANLANMNTPGFKPDIPAERQRDVVRIEDNLGGLPSNKLLEQLGGGVQLVPNRVTQRQGMLETTGNPLDVGITGSGYLVVRDGVGPESERFTRDGRLTINKDGILVQASTGRAVLSTAEQPIPLERDKPVRIDSDGAVSQNGRLAGRLSISNVADPTQLRKLGDNMLTASREVMARRTPSKATLTQGSIERSAVDPIRATMDISTTERAASRAGRMIQLHDEVMQRTINTFGKLA